MPNTIELNLLENKSIVATMQGYPLANENSYKIIAGEENSTKFIIKSIPNQYANARLTVEMVNSKGYVVAETDINEIDVGVKGFALPVGMAVAGYGYVSIKAYIGDEVAVFQPLKLKVWNTIPQWQDYVDKTANDFFMQDETATVLTFEFGAEGGLVTLDLAKTKYSSVYFDQYARIPEAGNTTVSFSFASGRHYVTLINNTALSGVNHSSFITVGKENLIAVKISTLVNDIGADVFGGCTALRKADIPFSANGAQRRIGSGAFYRCPLEELKIPEGFTEVGNECFGSVMAKEIELPTSLNVFGSATFTSSYIEKIICKATNPIGDDDVFTNALLIVPHDSVETYKSVFGYDKVEAYAYLQDVENLAPKGYRLIRDITLEEDVQQIDITTDNSGNQLKLKGVFIRFMGMFTATASNQSFVLRFNSGSWYQMYDFYNVTADRLYAHWIKSERMNTPTTDMWLSAYPFELCKPPIGELVNSQGLADMCRTVHSDIAWFDGGNRSINRIGYGCASVGGANMKAGSRIVIWGIDDDE